MVYQRRRISLRPDWRTSSGGSSRGVVEGFSWYSGVHNRSMEVRAASQVKFRVKIQDIALIEDIILRAETISRVKT
jgi:hypothetical protein